MTGIDSRVRVLLVEDHHIFRQALASALACDGGIVVVDACSTPERAIARLRQTPVDVVITDLEWRGDPYGGVKLIRQVRELAPETAVLVFSVHADEETVRRVLEAGARGYLLKDEESSVAGIAEAVRAVGQGDVRYSRSVVEVMARLVRQGHAPGVRPKGDLTPREGEVELLLRDGLSNAEIARRLGISVRTVKVHVSNVLGKRGLSSRYQVVDVRAASRV